MRSSWAQSLRKHIRGIVKGGNPRHIRAVSALLTKMGAELLEVGDSKHTTLLEKYPYMPIRYFSQCIEVPISVGRILYKEWHEFAEKEIPRHGNLDRGERKQWEEIVTQELLRKNK